MPYSRIRSDGPLSGHRMIHTASLRDLKLYTKIVTVGFPSTGIMSRLYEDLSHTTSSYHWTNLANGQEDLLEGLSHV